MWILNLSGGALLAGAIAVAVTPSAVVEPEERTAIANAASSPASPRAVSGVPSRDPAPKRSRRVDVSMATRFRPRGTVTVGGQVNSPGPVTMSGAMTMEQAIARAGGATEFGSLRRVKLIRDGQQKTFDLTKPEFKTMILKNHDVVEVPQKMILGR